MLAQIIHHPPFPFAVKTYDEGRSFLHMSLNDKLAKSRLHKLMIRLRLSTLLRIAISSLGLLCLFRFYSRPAHPYIDQAGITLIAIFCATLYAVCGRFSRKYPPALLITVMLVLFILTRLSVISFYPESFLGWGRIRPETFTGMLVFLDCATAACFWGVAFGFSRGYRGGTGTEAPSLKRTTIFGWLFLFSLAFHLSIYYCWGYIGATGSGEGLNFFVRYVSRTVNYLLLLMVYAASHFFSRSAETKRPYLPFYVGFGFLLFGVLKGNRGGMFELTLMFLCYEIFFFGDVSWRIKPKTFLMSAVLIPLSLGAAALLFNCATTLRKTQWNSKDMSFAALMEVVNSSMSQEVDYEKSLTDISERLSLLEPTYYSMYAVQEGYNDISDLVNIKTTVIASLNRMIPGKPFGEILPAQFAYGFIYRDGGVKYEDASGKINYAGYEWGLYGISYQLFSFAGGLAFIFAMTALLCFWIGRMRSELSFERACYGMFAMFTLQMWIKNFGIEDLVDGTWWFLVVLVLYLAIYKKLWKRPRRLGAKPPQVSA